MCLGLSTRQRVDWDALPALRSRTRVLSHIPAAQISQLTAFGCGGDAAVLYVQNGALMAAPLAEPFGSVEAQPFAVVKASVRSFQVQPTGGLLVR